MYQQTSWMLSSIWVIMYCSLCGSDFKSVSELRLTQAFYTSGHVSGVISGGMYRTFPTVKNPLHLTNQNALRLGQRLRSRAYRNFIGWLQVVEVQGVSLCQSKLFRLCGTASHVPWRLPRINFKVWENSASSESLERLSNYANMIHDKRFVFTKTL